MKNLKTLKPLKSLKSLKPLKTLMALMALMTLMALLTSCRSISSTQVEKAVSTDTVRVVQLQRDSVYLRDSVFVSVMQRGDTVFLTKNVTKTAYRDRWRTDTTKAIKATKDLKAINDTKTVTRFPWWAKLVTVASIVWGFLCVAYVALREK